VTGLFFEALRKRERFEDETSVSSKKVTAKVSAFVYADVWLAAFLYNALSMASKRSRFF
jgi:hypothetical protein